MKSTKKKKLPTIGIKRNEPSHSEEEANEIQSILIRHKELFEEARIEKTHLLIDAEWDISTNEAKVTKNSGSSLEVFGHGKNRHVYLYPEETLYLIEMNKLQLFFNNIRVSVQRAYSIALCASTNITTNDYRIYKHFVVHGYKLFRHENITENVSLEFQEEEMNIPNPVAPEILTTIKISSATEKENTSEENILKISYDVYLPSTVMKKTSRPKPNFYLIILQSRTKIMKLLNLIHSNNKPNILFASADGNTISVFNLQDVQIPNLF